MPDFFDDQSQLPQHQDEQSVEEEKIKVGEKEYSQADLQRLVGLGEIGIEAEQKYKTKIDRVWPNYQQVINEKKELSDKLAAIESEKETQHQKELEDRIKQMEAGQQPKQDQAKADQQPQLTREQIREIALKQAEELGIGPQAMRKMIVETMQGQQLINDITGVIDNATEEGWVKNDSQPTVEDVLQHMQDTGIRNPLKAVRDMYDEQYVTTKAEKLASIKRAPGLPTVSQSTAGAKVPSQNTNFRRMNDQDLTKLVNDALAEVVQQ